MCDRLLQGREAGTAFSSGVLGCQRGVRVWLAGFILIGGLLTLVGPLMVLWRYHVAGDPKLLGLYFLVLNAGYLPAAFVSSRLIRRIPVRGVAWAGCLVALAALVGLSFAAPPAPTWWRMAGLAGSGMAAGVLATAVLHGLEPACRHDMAKTLMRSGYLFGIGSAVTAAIAAWAYAADDPALAGEILAGLAVVYLVALAAFREDSAEPLGGMHPAPTETRLIATVLVALLVFFQFGNEGAIAGWLPLFLLRELGSSPVGAIAALVAYYLCLLAGRWLTQQLIPAVNRRNLLLGSLVTTMAGYVLLVRAENLSTAFTALAILGFSFGPIYPLLAKNLDDRFQYRPRLYTRLFSIGVTGAMTTPWLAGYVCAEFGMKAVVLLPAIGSAIVCVLGLLLRLEGFLMREPEPAGRSELLY